MITIQVDENVNGYAVEIASRELKRQKMEVRWTPLYRRRAGLFVTIGEGQIFVAPARTPLSVLDVLDWAAEQAMKGDNP